MANLVDHVVVDSGAFIRNAPVKDIGQNIYCIADVVSEIKDKPTRQRLQVLPYELKFVEPDSRSIQIVTDFTKKTGDYPSLSATDIRLIALTYQLEVQHVGKDHIKLNPDNKVQVQVGSDSAGSGVRIAGFYSENISASQKENLYSEKTDAEDSTGKKQQTETAETGDGGIENNDFSHQVGSEDFNQPEESVVETTASVTEEVARMSVSDRTDKRKVRFLEDGETLTEEITEVDSDDEEEDESEEENGEGDSDLNDDGWITPSNVNRVNLHMRGVDTTPSVLETKKRCVVGCLTTDFAMQNVLIQMGLNVLSVDGYLIKKARSYVLRCYACFKITTNMEKQFCHHCGNKTLRRLSVAVNEDGSMKYFFSKRQPRIFKQRAIPLPRGGKYSNYPKLTEDQKLPQRRKAKMKEQHFDVFDPDYIANHSPFATRDTTSRSAILGVRNFNKRDPQSNGRRHKK